MSIPRHSALHNLSTFVCEDDDEPAGGGLLNCSNNARSMPRVCSFPVCRDPFVLLTLLNIETTEWLYTRGTCSRARSS